MMVWFKASSKCVPSIQQTDHQTMVANNLCGFTLPPVTIYLV